MEITKHTTTEEMQAGGSLAWDYRDEAINLLQADNDRLREALILAEIQLREDDSYGEERETAHKAIVEALSPNKCYHECD